MARRYELIGDDVLGADEIIGADTQAISALPGYPGGATLRTRTPTRAREQVLGLDSVAAIAAAATVNVTSRPQVTFRPDRLVIAGSIAAAFLINSFFIGRSNQLIGSSALPAEVFGQQAFGVRLKLDTAQVSQDITLNVTNTSGGALRFNAALIGPSVE